MVGRGRATPTAGSGTRSPAVAGMTEQAGADRHGSAGSAEPMDILVLTVEVNGRTTTHPVAPRTTLADYLRDILGLTGTHLGCEQGACGACTVLVDGRSVRSCLMLAGQAEGRSVITVEALAAPEGPLGRLQQAFADHDALQCGFCTPGMLMAATELVGQAELDEATVRDALSGNLCRCTGYQGAVAAVMDVHRAMAGSGDADAPTPTAAAPPTDAATARVAATAAVALDIDRDASWTNPPLSWSPWDPWPQPGAAEARQSCQSSGREPTYRPTRRSSDDEPGPVRTPVSIRSWLDRHRALALGAGLGAVAATVAVRWRRQHAKATTRRLRP